MANTLGEQSAAARGYGATVKKLQIPVARGHELANIRAPFPYSGFGAKKNRKAVGSWLKLSSATVGRSGFSRRRGKTAGKTPGRSDRGD
jgi:hypothetical protein